jgi:hypothetical protein
MFWSDDQTLFAYSICLSGMVNPVHANPTVADIGFAFMESNQFSGVEAISYPTAILNSGFADIFRRFGSVFRWVECGTVEASGQGGRIAAAAIDWSRWGQSWKTT